MTQFDIVINSWGIRSSALLWERFSYLKTVIVWRKRIPVTEKPRSVRKHDVQHQATGLGCEEYGFLLEVLYFMSKMNVVVVKDRQMRATHDFIS